MTIKCVDKKIHKLHTVCRYKIIVDFTMNETLGIICSYGLHVYEKIPKGTNVIYKNISTNFTLVRHLYEKLVDNDVLPIHVKDIIEDEIYNLHKYDENFYF